MKLYPMGTSGIRVSELGLGTMRFGGGPNPIDRFAAQKIVAEFEEAGGNLIDTSPVYGGGASESMVGSLLKGKRDRFAIISKVGCLSDHLDPNSAGLSSKAIVGSVARTLAHLGTDYIDVLLVHVHDPWTPPEVWMSSVNALIQRGCIRAWGFSNVPAWVASEAATRASGISGCPPPAASQIQYSLIRRDSEVELVPLTRRWGAAVMAWSPLAGGIITGRADNPSSTLVQRGYGRISSADRAALSTLEAIRSRLEIPIARLAIGWLRAQGAIPILGASTSDQLEELLDVVDLTGADLDDLTRVAPPNLIYPHDFLLEAASFAFGQFDVRSPGSRKVQGRP